jgi:hypothetical protein
MKKININNRSIFFPSHEEEIRKFEAVGETELRYKMAQGTFFGNFRLAEEWLRQQEQSRRDARQTEMLKIANKASSDARSARIVALIAAAIAAMTAIITTYIKVSP